MEHRSIFPFLESGHFGFDFKLCYLTMISGMHASWGFNSKTTEIQDYIATHPAAKQMAWFLWLGFCGLASLSQPCRLIDNSWWGGDKGPSSKHAKMDSRGMERTQVPSLISHQRPKVTKNSDSRDKPVGNVHYMLRKLSKKSRRKKKSKTEPSATLAGRFGLDATGCPIQWTVRLTSLLEIKSHCHQRCLSETWSQEPPLDFAKEEIQG